MWPAIISFLGGPVISGAIAAYKAKLEAGNTTERIAADLAARELLVEQRELELQQQYKTSLIGHWFEVPNILGYIMVSYFGKIVVYDKMLGWGSTDPITGDALVWAGMVMAFWIGSRGIINVAKILKG